MAVEVGYVDLYHSEEWWLRALDAELSATETTAWLAHRQVCLSCCREWDTLMQVEGLLRATPALPALPATFTARTVTQALQRQRLQSIARALAAGLIVGVVTWLILGWLGSAYFSLEQFFYFILGGRQAIFQSCVLLLDTLLVTWQRLLPWVLLGTGLLTLLLMPNGIAATFLVVWMAQQRRVAG